MTHPLKKNGLWYNLNSEDNTAEVIASQDEQYSGDISIPSSIYNNKSYVVTSIGESAFEGCSGLTSITIPTSIITIEKGAFYGCSGLTYLAIPESVTSIGVGAFSVCYNLTSIYIPSSVTKIDSYAFDHCPSLNHIVIIRENPFAIDNTVFETFDDSYNVYTMATLVVPDGAKSAYRSAAGWSNFTNISEASEQKVRSIHVAKAGTLSNYITDIEKYQIEELTLTGELNGTDFKLIRDMGGSSFHEGSNVRYLSTNGKLKSLDIKKKKIVSGGTYYVLTTFDHSWAFTRVNTEGEEVYTKDNRITHMLFAYTNIETIVLPNNVISIDSYAFWDCKNLTSFIIPNSVKEIGRYAFIGCSNLTSIIIPKNVTTIISPGPGFSSCNSLKSITVEADNPKYDSRSSCNAIIDNDNKLIDGCKNTIIPNSVTSIGDCAFESCNGLTSMTIPDNVTSIGYSAFKGCKGLVYISLPSNLTSIGTEGLSGCTNLNTIYCKAGNVPSAPYGTFSNPENIILYIPYESLEDYRSTEPWNRFKKYESLGNIYIQATEKCSKPIINMVNGNFEFSCEMSNVTYYWSITTPNGTNGWISNRSSLLPITLNVYAAKSGYLNSDVATYEFNGLVGDVDGNGVVNVADHVKLSSIIMEQSE